MKFTIKIADINIGIKSIYDEVWSLCDGYISDEKAAFWVETEAEDIAFEREKAKSEAAFEKRPYVDFCDSYLETLAVYRKIAVRMLDFDIFLMHGAALGVDGGAYLFTAPSGVGKTTHTRFWCEMYPDAFIINGDKPLIKITDNGVFVCGTPWAGKEGLNRNVSLPLKAVCTLFRGKENIIEPIDFGKIYPLIIGQTYRPSDEKNMQKTLELVKKLGKNVRFYTLFCNLEPEAARIAKEGMDGSG